METGSAPFFNTNLIMAKVKTEKEVDEQVKTPAEPDAESNSAPEAPAKKETEVEIPENVLKILKLYPNMKELYVDAKGGVYTKSAPAQIVKGVTLYKNPYFKK